MCDLLCGYTGLPIVVPLVVLWVCLTLWGMHRSQRTRREDAWRTRWRSYELQRKYQVKSRNED